MALALLILALASPSLADPPETLKLSDLARHPERWPAEVTLNREFAFAGGKTAKKGQSVKVIEFDGREVVVEASADLLFAVAPQDCNLLEAANAFWKTLTPTQRAVDTKAILADASLWPEQVKSNAGFTLSNGKNIPAGREYPLLSVTPQGVELWAADHQSRLLCDIGQTDIIARARQRAVTEPAKRPSRIVKALTGQRLDTAGKAASDADLEKASIFAFYYSASWCGPCRKFTPGFVEYINGVSAKYPELVVVFMSNDNDTAKMTEYMTKSKMPWCAVPPDKLKASPLLNAYTKGSIPQLALIDRHGKLLSDCYDRGRYVGPNKPLAALKQMLAKMPRTTP